MQNAQFRVIAIMPTRDEMAKFAKAIDLIVAATEYNYIEAIVEHCKNTGLEL